MPDIKSKLPLQTLIFALIVLILTAFVFANSSASADESEEESDFFVAAAESLLGCFGVGTEHDALEHIVRKTAHFTEYFALGAVASMFAASFKNASVKKRISFIAFAPLYCLAVALCDEFIIQNAVEGRTPEMPDAIIDFSGAVIASVTVAAVIYLKNKKTTEKGDLS